MTLLQAAAWAALGLFGVLNVRRFFLVMRLEMMVDGLARDVERAVTEESRAVRIGAVRLVQAERERVAAAPIWRWTP